MNKVFLKSSNHWPAYKHNVKKNQLTTPFAGLNMSYVHLYSREMNYGQI